MKTTKTAALKTSVFREYPLKNACFSVHRARNCKKLFVVFCVSFIAAFLASCGVEIPETIELVSIAVTQHPAKKAYNKSGSNKDTAWSITGMAVAGSFSDGNTRPITITASSITPTFADATASTTSWTVTVGKATATVDGITVNP